MSNVPRPKRAATGAWRVVSTVSEADEVPLSLPRRGAVLVGSLKRPKWLAFDCPCDKRHRIMVNLDPLHRPYWKLSSIKPLSLWPSIDSRTKRRRCHYFIEVGRVHWMNSRGGSR